MLFALSVLRLSKYFIYTLTGDSCAGVKVKSSKQRQMRFVCELKHHKNQQSPSRKPPIGEWHALRTLQSPYLHYDRPIRPHNSSWLFDSYNRYFCTRTELFSTRAELFFSVGVEHLHKHGSHLLVNHMYYTDSALVPYLDVMIRRNDVTRAISSTRAYSHARARAELLFRSAP